MQSNRIAEPSEQRILSKVLEMGKSCLTRLVATKQVNMLLMFV